MLICDTTLNDNEPRVLKVPEYPGKGFQKIKLQDIFVLFCFSLNFPPIQLVQVRFYSILPFWDEIGWLNCI